MPSVLPSLQDIVKAAITTLAVAAVLAIGGAVLGLLDQSVPLWLVIGAVVLLPLAYLGGKLSEAGESLEPYYVEHVREILDTLQKAIAGDIPGVSVDDFIERGILEPARQWLISSRGEDVRISILLPSAGRLRMVLAAGHSVEARQRFDLEIEGSFAGFALASGEMQWTNDVETDPRWRQHPQARPGREYGSLASMPVRVGEQAVAVLNVLSTEKQAFMPSELMYIDVLGSIINVVSSLAASGDEGEVYGRSDDQTHG